MRVKLLIPEHAAGLRDPHTKRSPFLEVVNGETRIVELAEVPENSHWIRRLREVPPSIARVDEAATPTGREPIATLTTRS